MSLSIHDIERSVGIDLLRRPFLAHLINASLLRFYHETLFIDPDIVTAASSPHAQPPPGSPPAASAPPSYTPDTPDTPGILQAKWFGNLSAVLLVLLTHLIAVLGLLETVVWLFLSVLLKAVRAPRIYAFEKLVLDARVLFARSSVKFVEKKLNFFGIQNRDLPRMTRSRQGIGGLVITTVKIDDALSRDSVALFKLLRYLNRYTISYFENDTLIFVGMQLDIVDALCDLGIQTLNLDLGWHIDVVEGTIFKIHVAFTRDSPRERETDVTFIGRRRVTVQLDAEASTENLELLAHVMDQFASVCEAGVAGRRYFNGKRFSIYMVGFVLAVILISLYEEEDYPVWKPSPDALTLAVGAFTLWMTVGKSAALGETEEVVELETVERKNILMTYHGFTKLGKGVVNICWVPEVFRPVLRNEDDSKGSLDGGSVTGFATGAGGDDGRSECAVSEVSSRSEFVYVDGSITKLEAALCLSIFEHFGHYVKWKGHKLVLDRYVLVGAAQAHVEAVERLDSVQELEEEKVLVTEKVERIGGRGRGRRRKARRRKFGGGGENLV